MRKFFRFLLYKPILWVVEKFSAAPDRKRIFSSLNKLKEKIETSGGKTGFTIPFEVTQDKFIIFSDQHKGRKNGADDFMQAESNYLTALAHYHIQKFHLICLGDSEELWENTLLQVIKHNRASFEVERRFAISNTFTKIF